MTQMNRVLRRAAIWLTLGRFAALLLLTASAALLALLGLRIADKLVDLEIVWSQAWMIAGAATLVVSVVLTIVTRRDRLAVARAVDENAGLREAISTALCVSDHKDSWSQAAVRHAAEVSRRVIVRQAFPIRAPRHWPAPLVLLALFFLAGLFPQGDLLGRVAKAEEAKQEQEELAQATEDVRQVEDQIKNVMEQLGDESLQAELEKELAEKPNKLTPEDLRRSALEKLTTARVKLDKRMDREDLKTLDAMQKRMKQMRAMPDGSEEMRELTEAMQKGDFQSAKEALNEMMRKMARDDMSPEESEKLAEQLDRLGEQLEQLAKNQDALEQALEEAGLDKEMMNNPAALQKAIQQADGLSKEQKQQLQQMAQACQQANQACEQMAQACQNAAQQMGGQEMQQAMQSMGEMGQQLSQMEMLQQQMSQLESQSQQLQNQIQSLCEKMGQCEGSGLAMGNKPGPGVGSRGMGGGFANNDEPAPYQLKTERSKTKTTQGRIIGRELIEGDQVRGEAVQALRDEVAAATQAFDDEAMEEQSIPREFHETIKTYFGRLDRQTRVEESKDEASDDESGS